MGFWTHTVTTIFAAFSASLVEFTEALTIILAVGVSRGWRPSLLGAACGAVVLGLFVLICGPLLTQQIIPLSWLQLIIGILLLLFGLRWLRKAVLRSAGVIPLHDEAKIYEKEIGQMAGSSKAGGFDLVAFVASLKAVFIEGIEVVFIIVAMGTAQTTLVPAITGAGAALLLVIALGFLVHGPLTRIPENTLKFGVAVILSAFGLFWIGEGNGFQWPGSDLAIPVLTAAVLLISLLAVRLARRRHA